VTACGQVARTVGGRIGQVILFANTIELSPSVGHYRG
jgi:hypothetical protein